MKDTVMIEETAQNKELIPLMESRSQTYGLLSRLFRSEADEDLLIQMRMMKFPKATGNNLVDEGYELLYKYLRGTWADSVTELAIDYVRTFIGHGVNGFSAAYPFESVHTSERRLLMQEARAEVLAIYRANNLKRGAKWSEGEDHIAVEFEFMQIMCERTNDALRNNNEEGAAKALLTQYSFLMDHLLNWVPMLVADMEQYARTGFYQGLAKLTMGFICTDKELLEDLLEESLEEELAS